ncbi:MAG: GNAT family N-acetyltransferase [Alphaproteobacteria bacterium]|nr:GNAT family N-acetyltransferase [Alphaproteobacteria bacterium]MBU2084362.1 GNAT family N-acetyltransferase [Alphaproteobacteria bacterium]MBU2143034.1 GNAT family N-acetyltransferase [Alphaproteobacteria bacterium]MBU2195904.1 GNAT family N-acetyltransferase [Alphaproteobacteria bacterium]
MRLRPPSHYEYATLTDLCMRSKAVWGYPDDMLEEFRAELTIAEEDVESSIVIVADDIRGIAGVAQVALDGQTAWLEKLFVEPTRLGEGTGQMMYVWACRVAQDSGAADLVIDCDPDAMKFYTRMGAEPDGEAESPSISGRMLPRLVHRLHPMRAR